VGLDENLHWLIDLGQSEEDGARIAILDWRAAIVKIGEQPKGGFHANSLILEKIIEGNNSKGKLTDFDLLGRPNLALNHIADQNYLGTGN
jgi:hypothetical protein